MFSEAVFSKVLLIVFCENQVFIIDSGVPETLPISRKSRFINNRFRGPCITPFHDPPSPILNRLRENIMHDFPVHISQAKVSTCIFIRQLQVVHSQQVQDRRV